jgi:hypothetical protein
LKDLKDRYTNDYANLKQDFSIGGNDDFSFEVIDISNGNENQISDLSALNIEDIKSSRFAKEIYFNLFRDDLNGELKTAKLRVYVF